MFKSNLFVTFISFLMLTTSLGIQHTTISNAIQECDVYNTVYLVEAENGIPFYTNNNIDGTVNVTYDCSLSNFYEGTIHLDDKRHPKSIDSLFIKNCLNITLRLSSNNTHNNTLNNVKSVHVTGLEELSVITYSDKPLKTVITDVKMLNWSLEIEPDEPEYEYEYEYKYMHRHPSARKYKKHDNYKRNPTSLILKNVVVKHFDDYTIDSIYMTGVIAQRFTPKNISCSVLSIKDSRFDYLQTGSVNGTAKQVYIVNTTFETMLAGSFNLQANESFIFSGNHVMEMFDAFNITCPNVEIVGNTIHYAKNVAFRIDLSHPISGKNLFNSLNVSLNKINTFQNDLIWLAQDKMPDFLVVERNHFNCTCKTSMYLKKLPHLSNTVTKLLLDEQSNNVCANFENCPLRRLLGKETSVCKNTFVCPNNDLPQFSAASLEQISSVLKNLTEALYSITKQNETFKFH